MAYQIVAKVTAEWIGEGTGPMTVPSAQSTFVQATQPVPGAVGTASLTAGQITSACASLGSAVAGQLTAANILALMQGWASGGQ